MTDSKRQQLDIRSFFGQNASKPDSKPTPAAPVVKKPEPITPAANDQGTSQKSKPAKKPAVKRTPAKAKEKVTSGKKGMAVTKKKTSTAKAKQPKKKPVKRAKTRRSREEQEEYDSDFVTSDESDSEESSDEDLEPKQKGRKRIICSDGESDVEVVEIEPDVPDEKRLVNQTITNFVSSGSQKMIEKKPSPPPSATKKQEISSRAFFGASSKPKLVKASGSSPAEILLKDSKPKYEEELDDDLGAVIDSEMITDHVDTTNDYVHSPELKSPSVAVKENIAPVDVVTESVAPLQISGSEPADEDPKTGDDVAALPDLVAPEEKPKAKKKWNPNLVRAAPKLLGQKEIPEGAPNCLAGKRFVITGVLESLERDNCSDLIKKLGGNVTNDVSSRTTHLIVGDVPGESKLAKAKKHKVQILDEDGLFRLISSSKSVPMAEMPTVEIKLLSDNQPSSSGSPSRMWVDKYKPASSDDLCANPGVISKIRQFLEKWPNTEEGKHAVLLSGPPGIGKSSAAAICAKEAGYNVIELNASTARSKKALHEHAKELLQSYSISEFFGENKQKKHTLHKTVLIMDEVDGMSGGDRGGMQELYSLIKTTKVPIICICNDRASPKVKTLANYCIDLRFRRPMAAQVAQRLLSIAKREGLQVDQNVLTKLVETTRGDIRQMLNTMQLWRTSSQTITFEDAKNAPTKDFENSPFDLAPELFRSISPHQSDWMSSRMDVYFSDPSLIPLMVQSNYLNCIPQLTPAETSQSEDRRQIAYLERYAKAACSMSDGDLVETNIRGRQSWSLMPVHAIMSSVAPGVHVAGRLQGRIEFPQWLGKNATYGKNLRLLSELHSHVMSKLLGTSAQDLNLDYLPALRRRIVQALTEHGTDGIDATVCLMNRYNLTRSDLDIIFELCEPISGKVTLNTKVKTALTRTLTQRSTAVVSSRKGRAVPVESDRLPGDDELLDEVPEDVAEEENEVEPEILPASVKPTKSKAAPAKRKSTAKSSSSTSKKSRTK